MLVLLLILNVCLIFFNLFLIWLNINLIKYNDNLFHFLYAFTLKSSRLVYKITVQFLIIVILIGWLNYYIRHGSITISYPLYKYQRTELILTTLNLLYFQKPAEEKYPVGPWLLALFIFVVCGSGN